MNNFKELRDRYLDLQYDLREAAGKMDKFLESLADIYYKTLRNSSRIAGEYWEIDYEYLLLELKGHDSWGEHTVECFYLPNEVVHDPNPEAAVAKYALEVLRQESEKQLKAEEKSIENKIEDLEKELAHYKELKDERSKKN